MGQTWPTFDNSLAPLVGDFMMGYGLVSGVTVEKRWTVAQVATLIGNTINITKLDGTSDNYVEGIGSVAAAGAVTIQPGGVDVNQDLILKGLGTGVVQITGTLAISADLDLNNNDLLTTGGDVITAGGNINSGGGTLTLGAGHLLMATGDLTMTSGSLYIQNGNLLMSAGGVLNMVGGALLTDSIAVSLAGFITITDDIVVGVGAESITVSTIIGNMTAPPAGNEPIDLEFTGVTDLNGETFVRDKAYFDSDVMSQTYLRASIAHTLTAHVGSSQGDGLITKEFNQYSTVANVGDAATLPVLIQEGYSLSPRLPYLHIIVRNDGANAMDVFPNTGGTIDGGVVNAAVSVAAGTVTHFYGVQSGGTNLWFTA